MSEIHSYPKVHALGHPQIDGLLDGDVVVQEKYDGSQFSWMWDDAGNLHVRSKGGIQYGGAENRTDPDGIFSAAVAYLRGVDPNLPEVGSIYRGEVFAKPKHNTLAYSRVPANGLILYDIELSPNRFAYVPVLEDKADQLGIEAARLFWMGLGSDVTLDWLKGLLENESTLGGPLVEGVVIKNYDRFGRDGKILAGKYVSDSFKEKHKREWKGSNPSAQDVVESLIASLNTPQRWEKAIQHLRDEGRLEGSVRDIGPLMKEVKRDTIEEEAEWIAAKLAEWATPKVARAMGSGLPEWYKERLAEGAFV